VDNLKLAICSVAGGLLGFIAVLLWRTVWRAPFEMEQSLRAEHQTSIASLNVEWEEKITNSQAQISERQATIDDLSKQLAIPDQALTEHVKMLLAKTSDKARSFLRIAALHDVFDPRQLNIKDLRSDEIMPLANECVRAGLLTIEWVDDHRGSMNPRCQVPPGFRNILIRLLNA
jgi:hypothetical protein